MQDLYMRFYAVSGPSAFDKLLLPAYSCAILQTSLQEFENCQKADDIGSVDTLWNRLHRQMKRNETTRMSRRAAVRIISGGVAALAGLRLGHAWASGVEPASSILLRRIPSSDETLPVIGLGTWQTFDVEPRSAERRPLEQVLQAFTELGGRLVDTSPMYGRSEEVLGEITATLQLRNNSLSRPRCGLRESSKAFGKWKTRFESCEVDRVDLMQVHNLVDDDAA
jgi:hypothetical protein